MLGVGEEFQKKRNRTYSRSFAYSEHVCVFALFYYFRLCNRTFLAWRREDTDFEKDQGDFEHIHSEDVVSKKFAVEKLTQFT